MRKLFFLLLTAIYSFTFNSCKKNEVLNNTPETPYVTGKTITTYIAGKITAQDGTALNNVTITIGTATVITDITGNFIVPKAILNQNAGFIKATKTGYFAGSRTIIAKENVINNIVIQLIKKVETGNFINATGGTITVATGGNIQFPANAVATKTGAAYTGTVKVSASYLDPTNTNCYKEMPGDLRGITTSNNEQILTSYGMMNVELTSSNGEPLQLANGKTATLTMPIVTSIQANAPAIIPLWYFDEIKAMWVEQGTATKTGNNYVGTVSHFTWWNCDASFPIINYKVKFVYNVEDSGTSTAKRIYPLANALVTITRKASANTWASTTTGITKSDGSIDGDIPYNETLEMNVYASPKCINSIPIYTATIGAFTQNTDGGTVVVPQTISNISQVFIKGSVVNCSNKPVINGYAIITLNSEKYYEAITNGTLNKTIVNCNGTITGTANI